MGNPTNLIQDDAVIDVYPTAPASPVVGMPCRLGDLPGIALETPDSGNKVPMRTRGVFRLPVTAESGGSGSAVAIGDDLFWGDTDDRLDKTRAGKIKIGVALEELSASAQGNIDVFLRGRTDVPLPGAPTNIRVDGTVTYTSFDILWNAPADTGGQAITGYQTRSKKTSDTAWGTPVDRVRIGADYELLDAGTSYDIQVRAQTGNGFGPWSDTFTQATNAYTVPSAPATPTSSAQTSSSITVNWNAPASTGGQSVVEYRVRRKLTSDTTWGGAATAGTSTSHTASSLTADTSYDFQVAARNSVGWSDWSSTLTVSTTT